MDANFEGWHCVGCETKISWYPQPNNEGNYWACGCSRTYDVAKTYPSIWHSPSWSAFKKEDVELDKKKDVELDKTKQLLRDRAETYGPTWFLTSKVLQMLYLEPGTMILSDLLNDGVVFHNWFMILGKLMRLLKSPRHLDTWKDIAGYARLVVDYIEEADINA